MTRSSPANSEQRCEAVYRATLAIATELSADAVLQKIVDAARELVKARFGALGVVDEERRRLTRFIVSGVTEDQIRAMGHWPRGLGLLGELIHFPRPLRVKDISRDPRSVGFPPNHPPMTSFLGVPIIRGGRVLGNLYMADRVDAEAFTEGDEEILALFATHAAIAIENARLYTETDIRLREKVKEVERAERRARFLAELGVMLLRLPPGEDPPLEQIAERATEPLGDVAAIYLEGDGRPNDGGVRVVFHRVPARWRAAREVLELSWEALQRQVIREGRPVLATEMEHDAVASAFNPRVLADARFSTALAVPIATRQTTYGVLASLTSRPLTLSEEDLRFARLIADRLGSALDSARLYRREREAAAEIEQLARLAQHRATELETVLDTMAEAVYVVDTGMNLVRVNRAYAELVGIDGREDILSPIAEHIRQLRPRNRRGDPITAEGLPMARALRGETFDNQIVLITPIGGGKDRFLSVSGAPIRNATEAIVAAVNVARDVTESMELDRMKDEFISVASHELRTPLTVVKGYAQVLAQRLQPREDLSVESKMSRQILDQANRMAGLAERLLDVSRLQFGRLTLRKEEVDLARLVADLAERMQVGLRDHTIRVFAVQPAPARVDASRLEQVLSNLISNAAKYSPPGTEIDVELERRDGKTLVSVRDRGYGIPEDQQPYLFQRFFRARTGESKTGLGLGLYLSKGIVEAHGGKIWFDSQEGRGTTFYVLLQGE